MTGSTVHGVVAPGFDRVQDTVASSAAAWGRGGGGFAAYVDGQLVVDLWGGYERPGQPWRAQTLTPVASITKSWAAVVVARLVEQGILDHTTPLATWWPEFGAHGKEAITLHHVLVHSSGVLGFDGQVAQLDADGCAGWKDHDAIAASLAQSTPTWRPGTQHGYHAVSYGWLLNEVVRRTTGRTIGDLFRTDVAEPLGLDAHLGTRGADLDRVARVQVADPAAMSWAQRRLAVSITRRSADPRSLAGRAFLGDGDGTLLDRVEEALRTPAFLEAEIPASNGTTTAPSLARLFACLAAGGSLDGTTLLQPESVEQLSRTRHTIRDTVAASALPPLLRRLAVRPTAVSYGLAPNPRRKRTLAFGPNPRTFFSAGFGGQLVVGDPDAGLSFASIRTDYTPGLDRLQAKVLTSLYAAL